VLISAAFIADGLAGGAPPGADSEDGGASLTRGDEGSSTPEGTGRGASLLNGLGWGVGPGLDSPRATPGSETGSRMGGGSRLGGNSLHGLDTSSAGTSGAGLGEPGRTSIF
jgi:hypothetical protein